MAEVWVATNRADDETPDLIRADDLRHLRLVGKGRPRLVSQGPGSDVTLVDSPDTVGRRFSGVVGTESGERPPLPRMFHLDLAAALEAARIRAAGESQPVVVHAVLDGGTWQWSAETYGAFLANTRAADTRAADTRVPAAGRRALL